MRLPYLAALAAALPAPPAFAESPAEAWVDFDAERSVFAEPAAAKLQTRSRSSGASPAIPA